MTNEQLKERIFILEVMLHDLLGVEEYTNRIREAHAEVTAYRPERAVGDTTPRDWDRMDETVLHIPIDEHEGSTLLDVPEGREDYAHYYDSRTDNAQS